MARQTPILERRFVPQGFLILDEGDVADQAYIIQSGKVQVFARKNNKPVELAKLGPGDIFGETALLFDEPRMASVKALEDCNLIVITRQTMEEKLKDSDATIRAIVKMMKERIKQSNIVRVEKTAVGVEDVHKMFNEAFKIVAQHLSPARRKEYQKEASPILREFLDLTQSFLDRERK